jgi:methionyl-tRNA formyltransferase
LALGLEVAHRVDAVRDRNVELGVVVAFGAMVPAAILREVPMVNVHFSLLPRWRGAAPVERAILAGDVVTGVCVMALEETLDTGPVFSTRSVAMDDKSAWQLTEELANVGAELLVATLATWGRVTAVPQSGEPTYAHKLAPVDFALSPERSPRQLARVVRLGRATAEIGGRRCTVSAASAQDDEAAQPGVVRTRPDVALGARGGWLVLHRVRAAGSREMDAVSWANGARLDAATQWSSPST